MTRKDYEALAKAMSETRKFYEQGVPDDYTVPQAYMVATTVHNIIERFSSYMKADNSNFNEAKFLRACGFDF